MLKNYKFLLAAQVMVLAASAPIFAMDAEEAEQAGKAIEFLGVTDGSDSDDEKGREDGAADLKQGLGRLFIDDADDQAGNAIPVVRAEPQADAQANEQAAGEVPQDGQAGEERGEWCVGCQKFHAPRSQTPGDQLIARLLARSPFLGQPASAHSAAGSKKTVIIARINGRAIPLDLSSDSEDADSQGEARADFASLMQAREAARAELAAVRAEERANEAENMAMWAIIQAKAHRKEADQAVARFRALRVAKSDGAQAPAQQPD